MRILIASDLHGSIESLEFLRVKALETQPDLLILLGDLVYHGPRNSLPSSYNTVGVLDGMPSLNSLPCPLLALRGNCDGEVDMGLLPFPLVQSAWVAADGLRIFASHGHKLPEKPPLPDLAQGSVILRGHTHIPRGETLSGFHFWNPGSLSLPKGGSPRSYGWYENGSFSVYAVDGEKLLEHKPGIS